MRFIFSALCVCAGLSLAAQDQLFKRDNSKLEVKVLEITPTEIKYKLFSYPDGPTIVVAKSDVALIIYQGGQHEVFATTPALTAPEPTDYVTHQAMLRKERAEYQLERVRELKQKMDSLTATKNWVFLNALELMNGGIALGYMREFGENRFDVTVQGAVGFTKPAVANAFDTQKYGAMDFDYDRKTIEATIGVHFHTTNTRPVTHFVGPMFSFSQFNGKFSQYSYAGPGTPTSTTQPFVMNRYSFLLNNGVLFRITRHLNAAMNMAVGFSNQEFVSATKPGISLSYNNSQPFINYVRMGFYLGYRF